MSQKEEIIIGTLIEVQNSIDDDFDFDYDEYDSDYEEYNELSPEELPMVNKSADEVISSIDLSTASWQTVVKMISSSHQNSKV